MIKVHAGSNSLSSKDISAIKENAFSCYWDGLTTQSNAHFGGFARVKDELFSVFIGLFYVVEKNANGLRTRSRCNTESGFYAITLGYCIWMVRANITPQVHLVGIFPTGFDVYDVTFVQFSIVRKEVNNVMVIDVPKW